MGRGVWEAAGCAKACPTTKKADAQRGRGGREPPATKKADARGGFGLEEFVGEDEGADGDAEVPTDA